MQPYFAPYIGYFQLMSAVDEFIIYDDVKYTKKGWINRNRILSNGSPTCISVPLKRDSDYLEIKERYLAVNWPKEKKRILNKIGSSYHRAPFFDQAFPHIEMCLEQKEDNAFQFIYNSLLILKKYLEIDTPLAVSSRIDINHSLQGEQRVLSLCREKYADTYINLPGGRDLYHKETFEKNGINLQFITCNDIHYQQYTNKFIQALSIIDVMMFNSRASVNELLGSYTID